MKVLSPMKRKFMALMITATTVVSASAQSTQYTMTDWKTIGQLGINTAAATGAEKAYNSSLENQREKTETSAKHSTAIAGAKNLYYLAKTNVGSFGQESYIYKQVAAAAISIATMTPELVTAMKKNPKSAPVAYKRSLEIYSEVAELVNQYRAIVANSTVSNPLKGISHMEAVNKETQDGYNLIDPDQRYVLAQQLLAKLLNLEFRVKMMIVSIESVNGILDIYQEIDFEGWSQVVNAEHLAKTIVNDWNNIKYTW